MAVVVWAWFAEDHPAAGPRSASAVNKLRLGEANETAG